MRETVIKMKNISKVYRIYNDPKERFLEIASNGRKQYGKDYYALNDINLEVKEGEILGVIGVNGSGKSTLLKIITGVLQPTTGSVTVDGRISALLELGAGFNPEYTGVENIFFNGMVMGFTRKQTEEKVAGIIEFADIGDFINQPVKTYSSGMLVRLAYAVAVSIEPDVLIVDEALAVGDVYFQMKSMSKMEELFRKGKTVIFVSHDTASVRKLCNKAIYLDKGQIVAAGTAKEVVDLYEAKARNVMSLNSGSAIEDDLKSLSTSVLKTKKIPFSINQEYMKLVEHGREGNGAAIVCNLEMLSMSNEPLTIVESGIKAKIRMFVQVKEDCRFSVGYHIRDSRNEIILGSSTVYEEIGEVEGLCGENLVVEFITELPLKEGRFNIMTVLSKTVFHNRTVEFLDITKDGFYFDVLEKKPNRIWNMVQLPNEVNVYKL